MAAELDAAYFVVDFADLSQVRALADKIRSEYPRIDVLVNNAGGMCTKIHKTPDGYEITYQVNYLAPFLLTTRLIDVLVDSRATVVNTTSSSQKLLFHVTVADLESTARRRPSIAYALAKLAIILFTRELHRRYHAGGLSAAVVHPGFVNTNFGQASGSRFLVTFQRTPVRRPDRPQTRSRPAGLVGVKHARCRMDHRRVLRKGNSQATCGRRSRAGTRAVGPRLDKIV